MIQTKVVDGIKMHALCTSSPPEIVLFVR